MVFKPHFSKLSYLEALASLTLPEVNKTIS